MTLSNGSEFDLVALIIQDDLDIAVHLQQLIAQEAIRFNISIRIRIAHFFDAASHLVREYNSVRCPVILITNLIGPQSQIDFELCEEANKTRMKLLDEVIKEDESGLNMSSDIRMKIHDIDLKMRQATNVHGGIEFLMSHAAQISKWDVTIFSAASMVHLREANLNLPNLSYIQKPAGHDELSSHFAKVLQRQLGRYPDDERTQIGYELALRLRPNGYVEVVYLEADGSVVDAGGIKKLVSGLYVRARTDLRDAIRELEQLLNNPKTQEHDIQRLFELYPDLLKEDERDKIIPQARIACGNGPDWRADFFLKPVNDVEFCSILELKLPQLKINARKRSGHDYFYSELLMAVKQLKDYGLAFRHKEVREAFKNRYGVTSGYPELHLIAGRKVDMENIEAIQRLQQEEGVRIHDYDSLIKRLYNKFK